MNRDFGLKASKLLLQLVMGIVGWALVVATAALAVLSLVSYPVPFVLMAFVLAAALPIPMRAWLFVAPVIAILVSAPILWLLWDYGEAEGGISGTWHVVTGALLLFSGAHVLAWAGRLFGYYILRVKLTRRTQAATT